MIDSDILIWILRGKIEFKEKFINLTNSSNGLLFITPIQIAEIHCGLLKNEIIKTENLLNSLITIDIDEKIGKLSGELMRKYKKSNHVTLADSLVAASTIINNLKIWTLNKKNYPMLKEKEFIHN